MNQENYIIEALEIVSTWNLPEEDLTNAIADQAMLLAGVNSEDISEFQTELSLAHFTTTFLQYSPPPSKQILNCMYPLHCEGFRSCAFWGSQGI